MSAIYEQLDRRLVGALESYSGVDSEFWSFRGKAARRHAHAYFQYPAMMVPEMQGTLIRTMLDLGIEAKSVYDPFVGSGTILSEAMASGLDFGGQDINPLAILLCRTKAGPFFVKALDEKIVELMARIRASKLNAVTVSFPGLDKWFFEDVAIDLSKIREAILEEPQLWARRFFWVALAGVVRLTSNSRTSTFKLHIRPAAELAERQVDPIETFQSILSQNFEEMAAQSQMLDERGLLRSGYYTADVELLLKDSTARVRGGKKFDLLFTSPPYGDNVSTVPYGQYSYLPLQWIQLQDIDRSMSQAWLSTTHEIDRRSLGGVRTEALKACRELCALSPSFNQTISYLEAFPRDRAVRVSAFCRDLNRCIDPILGRLNEGAYMVWTVGNRMVGGRPVPIDDILTELLAVREVKPVARIQRKIPNKRMAVKNNIAETMRYETILVYRKP